MPRDYYEVLGVSQGADSGEIKSAFRRLARQYHPDVSREDDAEAKFKEINEAYEVLSDNDKRARYDRFGHAGVNGGAGGYGAGFSDFGDIFDIFNSAFGGAAGGRRRGPAAGRDRRVDVTIDFVEAVFGVEKEIEFQRLEDCDDCDGTGAAEGSRPSACATCKGTGEVRQVQQTLLGSMVRAQTCPQCGGKGQVISRPCRSCDGSGRRRKRAVLSVKIPPGVGDGIQIQVRGDGDAGERGAPPGNLFVSCMSRTTVISAARKTTSSSISASTSRRRPWATASAWIRLTDPLSLTFRRARRRARSFVCAAGASRVCAPMAAIRAGAIRWCACRWKRRPT